MSLDLEETIQQFKYYFNNKINGESIGLNLFGEDGDVTVDLRNNMWYINTCISDNELNNELQPSLVNKIISNLDDFVADGINISLIQGFDFTYGCYTELVGLSEERKKRIGDVNIYLPFDDIKLMTVLNNISNFTQGHFEINYYMIVDNPIVRENQLEIDIPPPISSDSLRIEELTQTDLLENLIKGNVGFQGDLYSFDLRCSVIFAKMIFEKSQSDCFVSRLQYSDKDGWKYGQITPSERVYQMKHLCQDATSIFSGAWDLPSLGKECNFKTILNSFDNLPKFNLTIKKRIIIH
jgi:hypothetical protein